MTLQKRYSLIALGVLIFVVAAPFFVMSIRGYSFDFANRRFVKTGILVAKTEPKGATITLTGPKNITDKTPSTLRFLPPGDYNVRIEKEGFYPWEKRLTVRGGLVTWVNEGQDQIVLISKNRKLIEENTINPVEEKDAPDTSFGIEADPQIGILNLIKIRQGSSERQIIYRNIPRSSNMQVLEAGNGLVFVLLDKTLYQIRERLDYVADGVEVFNWDEKLNKLVYGNKYELNLYDPYDAGMDQRELLIRTTEPGGSFCIIPEMGYVFRVYGNIIRAVELDRRDRRNTYEALAFDKDFELVDCDNDGKNVIVFDGINYQTYNFRNPSGFSLFPSFLFFE